jgi:hypothetical protein
MALINSTARFFDRVESQVQKGELNSALRAIHRIVDQVYSEPLNVTKVAGSRLLDNLCQKIGRRNLEKLRAGTGPGGEPTADKMVVYVASRLHASGGHTAVLADLIRLAPPARSVILLTGVGGPTDQAAVQHRFDALPGVTFEHAPAGTHIGKLDWLQRRMMALAPADVWLINHHQDSVAVAAVQPDAGYRLHYLHHGDHHLCLGVYLPFADHVDVHPMGFHACRYELGMQDNRYLPMVVTDQGDRPQSLPFNHAGLVTGTAAGFNKIEIPYFIRYAEVLPQLLRASGGRHVHIGRLSPWTLHRIRRGLRRLGLPQSAFQYIPFVPSVWKALQEQRVDLYIASFPYGGARTLIEVMGAGVPLAVHSHCASRLLGTFDMAYEGALVWRDPQQLSDYVGRVDAVSLQTQSRLARARYDRFHTEAALKNALADSAAPLKAPPLLGIYEPDALQQALDVSNQVNVIGVFRRVLFRSIRRLRWIVDNRGLK